MQVCRARLSSKGRLALPEPVRVEPGGEVYGFSPLETARELAMPLTARVFEPLDGAVLMRA